MDLPKGVTVRKMVIDDLRRVFQLGELLSGSREQGRRVWTEQNLVEAIAGEIGLSVVAVRKKQLLGFLIGCMEQGEKPAARIIRLGIREDFKNSGIEREMIKTFRESAVSGNAGTMRAEIDAEDTDLLEIFKKFGFTEIKDKITMHLDL